MTPNSSESEKKFADPRVMRDKMKLALSLRGYSTIQDFASEVGYDRSFISKIIHGLIDPTLEQASKISAKLNVPIWDLFSPSDIRDLPRLGGKK